MILAFEGIDGCGKSSIIGLLKERKFFENMGYEPVFVREPGGSPLAEKIRGILLDEENSTMCDMTELLLFEASRCQLISDVVAGAVEDGKVVVYDRFAMTTECYQGIVNHGDLGFIQSLHKRLLEQWLPDLYILLDVDPAASLERSLQGDVNRLDARSIRLADRRRGAYLELAKQKSDTVKVVDANKDIEAVYSDVVKLLESKLGHK
jgi:dTMP kinase